MLVPEWCDYSPKNCAPAWGAPLLLVSRSAIDVSAKNDDSFMMGDGFESSLNGSRDAFMTST